MKMIPLVLMLALSVGCASRQAALMLTESQKASAVFKSDMTRALENAVKREAKLREVMRTVAMGLDAKDGTYTAAQIKALIEKYQKAQMDDLISLQAQINEHNKAFRNAAIAEAMVEAVRNYNATGLTASDVVRGITDAIQPGVTDIADMLAKEQPVTTGGN